MRKKDDYIFSQETIDSLKELGEVLLKIRIRLIKEGKLKRIGNKWVFSEPSTDK